MAELTVDKLKAGAKKAYNSGEFEAAKRMIEAIKKLELQQTQERNLAYSQENMLPPPGDIKSDVTNKSKDRYFDTTEKFSRQPREALKAYASRMTAPDRTFIERLKDAGMTGLSGLATAYTGGAGLLGDMFGGSNTNEMKLARDLYMMGEIAVPELTGFTSAASRIARLGSANNLKQDAALSAQNINVTPTLGMQGPGLGLIEAGLDKVPFSAGSIKRSAARTETQMEDALNKAVNQIGEATTYTDAGAAAKLGTDKFVTSFQDKADKLYTTLDKKIGGNTFVTAPKTIGALQELTSFSNKYPKIGEFLGTPKYKKLLTDLEFDGALNALPYELLKDLRSNIGKSIGSLRGPMSDLQGSDLKRLYSSLSDDMYSAAAASGPDALKSFERANNFYKAGMQRINGALTKVTKAKTDEQAYANILALTTADSPRGSSKLLNQIKKSLPKEEWSTVSSTIIRKLGEARVGSRGAPDGSDFAEFSPATFLTNWNKMDNSAKTVLTSGNIPQSARRELDDLARVAQRYKEKPISTGSAGQNSLLAFIAGSVAMGPVKSAAIVGGTYLSARAMTSTPFLKALNSASASDFTKLTKIARDGGPLASEASSLLRLISADLAEQEERN